MLRLVRILVVAVVALGVLGGEELSAQGGGVPAKDAAEIRAALDGMEAAWNSHDMRKFVSYMTDDVEWVNVVGMWWRGKGEVFKAHEAFHQTIFKNRQMAAPEKVEMRALTPDVVVVTSLAKTDGFTTPSGRVMPPSRNVLTETFVRREGRWLVAEGHNTTVDEAAAAGDPVKR